MVAVRSSLVAFAALSADCAAGAAAAAAVIAVLNRLVGGGDVIASGFDGVDDVNMFVENGRVAELLVAIVTLGLVVVLLQVDPKTFDSPVEKGLGAERSK